MSLPLYLRRSFWIALTTAVVKSMDSMAASTWPTILASGFILFPKTDSSDKINKAQAPSPSFDVFPNVTDPLSGCSKRGRSFSNSFGLFKNSSSAEIICPSPTVIGVTSLSNTPVSYIWYKKYNGFITTVVCVYKNRRFLSFCPCENVLFCPYKH